MKRVIYISVVAIGFACGLVGYALQYGITPDKWGGILLSALHLFIPRPAVALNAVDYNLLVRAAAVISGVSGFIAIALFWITVGGRTVSGLWTQFGRRNHILVVGEGAFADQVFRLLRKENKSAILASPKALEPEVGLYAGYRVQVEPTADVLRARAGLSKCSHVIVDRGEDGKSLKTTAELIKFFDHTSEAAAKLLTTRVADPIFSDRFFDVVDPVRNDEGPVLSVFDENLILARHALRTDPPFMRAAARDQNRVHALIVGFGDLGEKLLEQVLLTSTARDLDVPRVTIIDREDSARKNTFCAKSPRLLCDLPIEFFGLNIGCDPLEDPQRGPVVKALEALEQQDPFTVIYLALPTSSDNLKAALLLDRARQRNGSFCAPIAYRLRAGEEGGDFLRSEETASLPSDRGFIPMKVPTREMIDSILGTTKTEASAKRIHEAYVGRNPSEDADVPWSRLSDTYKRSNRRIMDHLPAKLWTVGVRHELPLTEGERNILKGLIDALNDDPQIMKLARVEHERWCLDRRLDGWTFGEPRDNDRLHHPLLVSFDKMLDDPEKYQDEVEKDIVQVKELLKDILDISE